LRCGCLHPPHSPTPWTRHRKRILRTPSRVVRKNFTHRPATLQRISCPARPHRQKPLPHPRSALLPVRPPPLPAASARCRPMTSSTVKLRIQLTLAGIFVTLLLAAVFTLGPCDIPFEP